MVILTVEETSTLHVRCKHFHMQVIPKQNIQSETKHLIGMKKESDFFCPRLKFFVSDWLQYDDAYCARKVILHFHCRPYHMEFNRSRKIRTELFLKTSSANWFFPIDLHMGKLTMTETEGLYVHGKHWQMEVSSKKNSIGDRKVGSESFSLRIYILSWIDFHLVIVEVNRWRNFLVHSKHYHMGVTPKQKIQPETKTTIWDKKWIWFFLSPIDCIL